MRARLLTAGMLVCFTGVSLVSCNLLFNLSGSDARVPPGMLAYESDDTAGESLEILPGIWSSQARALYPAGDEDWVFFTAAAGTTYRIEIFSTSGYTRKGGSDVDTYIYLFGGDAATLLAEDDDGGNGAGFSRIEWTAPADQTCYVRVTDFRTAAGLDDQPTGEYRLWVLVLDGTASTGGLWQSIDLEYYDDAGPLSDVDGDGQVYYYGIPGLWTYETGTVNADSLVVGPYALEPGAPALSAWEWLEDEPGTTYEKRSVLVSGDGGSSWDALVLPAEAPFDADPDDGNGWHQFTVDLSLYAGSEVLLRFDFDTFDEVQNAHEGWYLDQLRIVY